MLQSYRISIIIVASSLNQSSQLTPENQMPLPFLINVIIHKFCVKRSAFNLNNRRFLEVILARIESVFTFLNQTHPASKRNY